MSPVKTKIIFNLENIEWRTVRQNRANSAYENALIFNIHTYVL